jgi:hypothetical protein
MFPAHERVPRLLLRAVPFLGLARVSWLGLWAGVGGSIFGHRTGPKRLAVVGAAVTVTITATNVRQSTRTDAGGIYS